METDLVYEGKDITKQAEFSYPYLAETGDVFDLVYTWNRKKIVYCELKWENGDM